MLNPDSYILALADYAVNAGLIDACDRTFAINRLLEAMELDSIDDTAAPASGALADILAPLIQNAAQRGIIDGGSIAARDLFDTKLMGALTPFPHEVRGKFSALYKVSPAAATDWFYKFSQDVNYIRRDRIVKDKRWTYDCEYGALDISINLSKPEKDPKTIAAARLSAGSAYPSCQLCPENEGYAGRLDHPARQNHRIIPMTLCGENWFFQYSPYVYYNEHCIVLNSRHIPMKVDIMTFRRLLEFTSKLPHYFVGSNADLPIVGGSILSHDHFQGGRYDFAMARAPIELPLEFSGFGDVRGGIVRWPMSVVRLTGAEPERLAALADKLLGCWRRYTDEAAFIFAETGGESHNTITPIARRCGDDFQLDLVLRNNITTPEHPLGVFHPHAGLHHIKKENIGLIEVMGLAILPARLDTELEGVKRAILRGGDLRADDALAKHAPWAEELAQRHSFTPENADDILRSEVGEVFRLVLEDAGVYKTTPEGRRAFLRFIEFVNKER